MRFFEELAHNIFRIILLSDNIVVKLEGFITKLNLEKLEVLYSKIKAIDLEDEKYSKYKTLLEYMELRIDMKIADG